MNCVVPFSSLILEPDGSVSVCRMKALNEKVGDLRTETLREIWNGPKIRAWRRDFLDGTRSVCGKEIRLRRCHARPHAFASDVAFEETLEFPPLRIGLNLNGKCNLRCPMCNVWSQPNGFYQQPHIWRQIEELLPRVREIEMLGGEPFLQKDTYRIMKLVAKVNPTCEWNITTNTTWKLNDFVREHMDPLPFRSLIISTDSLLPEGYSKLRPPEQLEKFLENVDALSAYSYERQRTGKPKLTLATNCTIQRDNWREVPELVKFGLKHGNIVPSVSLLYTPKELSLLSLPVETREEILRYWLERIEPAHLHRTGIIFRPLLESVSPIVRAEVLGGLAELRPA